MYFAYGSNMMSERLIERVGNNGEAGIGFLIGYTLKFNKLSRDGSGKGNIVPDASEKVWGVLYKLTEEQLKILDSFENGYERKIVEIQTVGKTVEAVAYISDATQSETLPYGWYLEFFKVGAKQHGLPKSVQEHLNSVATTTDMDEERKLENLRRVERAT